MKLKIKNYQIIENLELETKGVTLITGRNNNGKSSLIRAIHAVCFGQLGSHFIRSSEKECTVELIFDTDIFKWVATKDSSMFYVNGDKYEKTRGKPPEEYISKLNIFSLDISKTVLKPNISMQFDPPLFILSLGPTEIANTLSFLFSGYKFPNVLKSITQEIKSNNKESVFIEGQLDQKEKEIVGINEKIKSFDDIKKWIDRKNEIFSYTNYIDDIDSEINEFESREKQLEEYNKIISQLKNKKIKLDNCSDGLLTDIESLNEFLVIVLKSEQELNTAKTEKELMKNNLNLAVTSLNNIVYKMENCPFCGNIIDNEKRKSLLI